MFRQTWQFAGNRILTNAAVAIGIMGDIMFSDGIQSGWAPVGLPKKVTHARGTL